MMICNCDNCNITAYLLKPRVRPGVWDNSVSPLASHKNKHIYKSWALWKKESPLMFPLPCGAGSTVPREGFDSSVIMPFSWCVVVATLPI